MTVGTLVQCTGNMIVVLITDFDKEAKNAQERNEPSSSSNMIKSTQLTSSPLFTIIDEPEDCEDAYQEEYGEEVSISRAGMNPFEIDRELEVDRELDLKELWI